MHVVNGEQVIYAFAPQMDPVLSVDAGDIVLFKSNDCYYQQVTAETQSITALDRERVNPATGPVFVVGAEPGDVLQVDILVIDVADKGVAVTVSGMGGLPDEAKKSIVRVIPIVDGAAEYAGLRLPIRPMIGVIGVAPGDADGPCPTDTPYKHGGNMDTKDIRQGSTLYLPVRQTGALLALGDCHALMGDGEIGLSGLEICADVTVRLSVLKKQNMTWPMVKTETFTAIIGSGDTLEEATRFAMSDAVRALSKALAISWEEAYILASLVVDARISQVVDPKRTVRAVISKTIATTEQILNGLN